MIQVGDIVEDSDFSQVFFVDTTEGAWDRGVFIPKPGGTQKSTRHVGTIYPSTPKEIKMSGEGDMYSEFMTFLSRQKFKVTGPDITPDTITWKGSLYKIISVQDYLDYGYNLAIGGLVE